MKNKKVKISIRNIKKDLGGKSVLKDVNLDIFSGETLVIIGQSGCGKSVLLKHIVGLFTPDAGEIFIDSEPITTLRGKTLDNIRSKFGVLFQGAALFDSLTVGENVAFKHIRAKTFSKKEIDKLVDEKLALVGLHGISHQKPAELSGGMKKRVGLARAIASDPEIILYDEPTTGLDPINADQINDLIIHLREELAITSIAVTHDMVSAYKISDRIAMLYDGKVIELNTPSVLRRSKNTFVKQFINGDAYGPITSVRPF
ncbi:MAG: ABC transporter ATP-binding protein [Spirochaetes bacterium]|nr:ABC transporter ATP-binding protein [Spirochaetota bacterium]